MLDAGVQALVYWKLPSNSSSMMVGFFVFVAPLVAVLGRNCVAVVFWRAPSSRNIHSLGRRGLPSHHGKPSHTSGVPLVRSSRDEQSIRRCFIQQNADYTIRTVVLTPTASSSAAASGSVGPVRHVYTQSSLMYVNPGENSKAAKPITDVLDVMYSKSVVAPNVFPGLQKQYSFSSAHPQMYSFSLVEYVVVLVVCSSYS